MITVSLDNVRSALEKGGVIQKERIYTPDDKGKEYLLLKDVEVYTSFDQLIRIPAGFKWDLSSVPRLLWPILPPDGDFEIAALIHDYLYRTTDSLGDKYCTRKEADYEMYVWSKATNNKRKWFRIDNWLRWKGVRIFGWIKY